MAISRFAASRVTQGLPKYQSAWDQDGVAAGALVPIASSLLTSATTTVSFSSIPQNYQDLMIVQSSRVSSASGVTGYFLYPNGDGASTNYCRMRMASSGTGTDYAFDNSASTAGPYIDYSTVGTNISAGIYASVITHILDYTGPNHKLMLSRTAADTNGGGLSSLFAQRWFNTGAITSFNITAPGTTFTAGSMFSLYGIRKLGQ